MPKLYIMCGLAFSGKSTLARKIAERTKSDIVAFDKLWIEQDAKQLVPRDAKGWRYIRDLAQEKVQAALNNGTSVVYDDNNPRKEHREELRKVAQRAGADSIVVYLDTPLDIIKDREKNNRISQSRHDVNPKDFDKVLRDLEIPAAEENVLVFTPEMDVEVFLDELRASPISSLVEIPD